MRPYYLPWELTSAIPTTVYSPPLADAKLHTISNSLEIKYSKALLIIVGDFNQANLRRMLPKYYQHVSCPTRGPNILYHSYTFFSDISLYHLSAKAFICKPTLYFFHPNFQIPLFLLMQYYRPSSSYGGVLFPSTICNLNSLQAV